MAALRPGTERHRRAARLTAMARIHPIALVDPGAQLADDVEIGPYSVIGPARDDRRGHGRRAARGR